MRINRPDRRCVTPRLSRPSRRGVAAFYSILILIALLAICSLAVDLGRVQVVKTELRRGADAAARAAASALPDVDETARLAKNYAQANSADGQSILLVESEDVQLGTWNAWTRTFSTLTGSSRSRADAVRVTLRRSASRGNAVPLFFGRFIGVSGIDVPASAVARLNRPIRAPGVVGIESLTMKGGDTINSFDSGRGPYSAQTPGSNVVVASNEPIYMNGACLIDGDAYCPVPDASYSSKVSGAKLNFTEPLKYDPPTLPATYTDHGSVTLKAGDTMALNGGNHVVRDLRMSGNATMSVTSPTTLYVLGQFEMNGNSTIAVAGNRAETLQINVIGGGRVELAHNDLHAVVYAPESPVVMNGNCNLFGSVVGRTILMNGNNSIHFDESLTGYSSLSTRILLVQ